MVTVKQFKEAGFDILDIDMCRAFSSWSKFEYKHLSPTNYDSGLVIEDLAWRKNKGVQPVGDDCVVEIKYCNGILDVASACDKNWKNYGLSYAIESWRPCLQSIIEKSKMNDNQETKTALEMSERDIESYADDCDVERELRESDEVVWSNGDQCFYAKRNMKVIYVGKDPRDNLASIVFGDGSNEIPFFFSVPSLHLSKPETPEQKAARERMEAAYDLYISCGIQSKNVSFDSFKKETPNAWLDIVDKTGYRKQ